MRRTRCVFLFSRSPRHEAWAKGLPEAADLVVFAARRLVDASGILDADVLWIGGPAPLGGLPALRQRGATFGDRLQNAFEDVRALGYREVIAVPSDVPQLSFEELRDAFERLETDDLVVGPSPDGGIYLLAARGESVSHLRSVRWLTSSVFEDALRAAANGGLSLSTLKPLTDVDSRRDLAALLRSTDEPDVRALLRCLLSIDLPPVLPVAGQANVPCARRAVSRGPPALAA